LHSRGCRCIGDGLHLLKDLIERPIYQTPLVREIQFKIRFEVQLSQLKDETANVARNGFQIAQIELRRRNGTGNDLVRMIEEVSIVRRVAAEARGDSHAADTPGSARPLRVVSWTRRNVPH